ncbi:chitin deacetylase [Hesseltinella vesiculosa]|uniref:chitin deacetylase n=1 Tax=Hesseltinella vesiculosa TaxID=101127 RepID=A0A1X2GGX6_9FUNG|nr:chitin deacetylase [Hesseltinella vesiculosa]
MFNSVTVAVALVQGIQLATAAYYDSFKSGVNPLNISIPSIPQTTSYDLATECTSYVPDPSLFNFTASEWPTVWQTATSNGINSSAEFTTLYNSIAWANAPNIPVRTLNTDGSMNTAGYDVVNDPNCWWTVSGCTVPKLADVNKDIYQCPEPATWGLTYDDGPNCSHNAFYDFLQEKNLKASMFYIGSNVMDWPYGAMRGVRDGHHIASHTWSHQYMTTLTNQELLAEFYYTQKAIHLATGVTPRYWRAPYGDVDDRVRWIASQLNMTCVLWDYDTNDWAVGEGETLQQVQTAYSNFIQMGTNGTMASSGNIVLTHEINNTTMQLAIDNLPNVLSNYKHVTNVATCQNITYPYFEQTISFPSFSQYLASNSSAGNASTATGGAAGSSPTTSATSTTSGALSLTSQVNAGLMVLMAMVAIAVN